MSEPIRLVESTEFVVEASQVPIGTVKLSSTPTSLSESVWRLTLTQRAEFNDIDSAIRAILTSRNLEIIRVIIDLEKAAVEYYTKAKLTPR